MTFKPLALAAFVLAGFWAFMPGPASSQPRDIYAVSGIQVNETAATAAAAQQAGFAAAQRAGYERLVRRVTAPAELAARGLPVVDAPTMERLVISVDVEEERRSAARYIGRLSVRFDPSGTRALLRGHGLTVIDSRTAPALVVATANPDTPPETLALWRQVWAQAGFGGELAPLVLAPETLQGGPAWVNAAPIAQSVGAAYALYANLRVQGSAATASVTEVGADARRERGEVSARINAPDAASTRATLAALAEQINALVQGDWKSRVAAGGGQRARLSASALYSSEPQWERIKQALEGAAQTLISEIRIEAVGREGALVSFMFSGDRAALTAELDRRGVRLEDSAQGPVLRVSGR
jgi:Uncharacterized protein conserved in bacteria (DUF2066)